MSLAVVVPGRGIVRWNRDGRRIVVPLPDSPNGREFMDHVDDVIVARRPLSPIEQAALLTEVFPGASIRLAGT